MKSSTSIKKVKVADLIPYANNSRLHSDEQVLQIASSIKEFGFLNPIIIDSDNGIIAGHGRVMAAKKLGIDELPCIDASHLTPAQKKAYVIADNKIALNSEWDNEILKIEFEALKELDFDLDLIGFNEDEINIILSDLDYKEAQQRDDLDRQQDYEDGEDSEYESSNTVLNDKTYTTKIDAPIYEPSGDMPSIKELYSKEKALKLEHDIHNADIDEEVRDFLIAATKRHYEFSYDKIADFYAHACPVVKDLMERSALVIIDYDKAIENGYIKMNKALLELRESQEDEA